jgi:peptidyl-prolyl cis-trans isomerase SurA
VLFRALSIFIAAAFMTLLSPVNAQVAEVIATVNDTPVTSYDIDQRIRLLGILGQTGGFDRRKIGNDLINDVVKISEAKRYKIEPTEKEIDQALAGMAKGLKTDLKGLQDKFAAQGLSLVSYRQYVSAQMSMSRLLSAKYKEKVQLDPGEADRKMAQIKADINSKINKLMSDPRNQPILVYSIVVIDFPVESNDPQLRQSRAIEAAQYIQKFKGCSSARAAASGIFNVRVGKTVEADSRKLPKQLKAEFDKRGIGKAIGPVPAKTGIQVIAYCGNRTIAPKRPNAPLPTKDVIERVALNEKYDQVERKYVIIMRKNAVIEYKDQSYVQ